MPFVEHVVEILDEDVPAASALETQMVGPSQDPVDLSVNIPKTQAKDDVPRAQNHYACLLDPTHNLVKKYIYIYQSYNEECINLLKM